MISTLLEGMVVNTDDPQQMGRMKVWVPAIDGDQYHINDLPWVMYVSPLGGQTLSLPAGSAAVAPEGYVSFGWWSIPPIGTMVIIGLINGDPNTRAFMGCFYREHGNRSLPAGRNRPDITNGPLTDTFSPLEPHFSNLKAQFDGKLDAPEAITRGVVERMVAQDKTDKDGKEGYQVSPINPAHLAPQTTCLTSPGHHSLIMQDNPDTARIRMLTAMGHQIILDDANERIYISTERGNNYIELDSDGRIHIFGANDVSLYTGGSLNLTAEKDINFQGENLNFSARSNLALSSCKDMHINSGGKLNLTVDKAVNFKITEDFIVKAKTIQLNPPKPAEEAVCATAPTTVPEHEPWVRPKSKNKRNKHWKR